MRSFLSRVNVQIIAFTRFLFLGRQEMTSVALNPALEIRSTQVGGVFGPLAIVASIFLRGLHHQRHFNHQERQSVPTAPICRGEVWIQGLLSGIQTAPAQQQGEGAALRIHGCRCGVTFPSSPRAMCSGRTWAHLHQTRPDPQYSPRHSARGLDRRVPEVAE